MFSRHAFLGLALAATGLVATGATVWAGEETARELHGPGARHAHHREQVVVDQERSLRRVDRLLESLRDLNRLSKQAGESVTIEIRRHLRDEVEGGAKPRKKGEAEQPDARTLHGVADRIGEHFGRGDRDDDIHDEMERRIRKMRKDLLALHDALERAPVAHPEPVIVIKPLSERAFREHMASLKRAHFESERLERLRDMARHVHVTSDQVAEVLRRLIPFEEYEAARILYPRIVDPENLHRVYDAMRWHSDRDRLRAYVRKHGR